MRKFLATVAAAVLALTLAACTSDAPIDEPTATLVKVTHTQTQAIPDFDSSEQVETDPERLQALQDLLIEYDAASITLVPAGCPGSKATQLTIDWSDDEVTEFAANTCSSDGKPVAEVFTKVTDLISSWRE